MAPNNKAPVAAGANTSNLFPQTTTRIEDLDIIAVWSALGGGPLRIGRGRAFWRNGDGPNVQLYPKTGTWKDFRDGGDGGGILRLVEVALGVDRREALAWLADNFGVAGATTYTASERREFARRRETARAVAEELIRRRDEAFNAIRETKRRKLEEYHRLNSAAYAVEDMELLAQAEGIWSELEALDAEGDRILQTTDAAALERLLSERRAA